MVVSSENVGRDTSTEPCYLFVISLYTFSLLLNLCLILSRHYIQTETNSNAKNSDSLSSLVIS